MTPDLLQIHRIRSPASDYRDETDQSGPLELPGRRGQEGESVFRQIKQVLQGDLQCRQAISTGVVV
jgi:hypothetical protein